LIAVLREDPLSWGRTPRSLRFFDPAVDYAWCGCWHRPLQICVHNDTLILDEDGLYDPTSFNDRLLLGMKGQMSEAERHFLRARLRGGILAKARRGEPRLQLPAGLAYDSRGGTVLDPDGGARRAISLLFDTFTATGSAFAVIQVFRKARLTFPARHRGGPRAGELYFRALTHDQVLKILHNPCYAGAYCYGRARHVTDLDGRHHTRIKPAEDWTVLLPLALEVALTVTDELAAQARHADALRAAHVQRAQHAADQARRLAVDPGNRLVADALVADWNARLRELAHRPRRLHHGQGRHRRPRRETAVLDEKQRAPIRALAGQGRTLNLPVPLNAWQQRKTPEPVIEQITQLLARPTYSEVARILNQRGLTSGDGKPWDARRVRAHCRARRIPGRWQRLRDSGLLTLDEAARELHAHPSSIKRWYRLGLIAGHLADDRGTCPYHPGQVRPGPAQVEATAEARRGAQLLLRDPGQDDLLPGLVGVEVSARERSGVECS
jgi:hypothetical protein